MSTQINSFEESIQAKCKSLLRYHVGNHLNKEFNSKIMPMIIDQILSQIKVEFIENAPENITFKITIDRIEVEVK